MDRSIAHEVTRQRKVTDLKVTKSVSLNDIYQDVSAKGLMADETDLFDHNRQSGDHVKVNVV